MDWDEPSRGPGWTSHKIIIQFANVSILRYSLHAHLYNIVDKVALKRTPENDIEASIEKQRSSELFDNVAVETYGLKNSGTAFAATSCLTKLRI